MRVRYSIRALPEDIPVRGNAMASGDDEYDRHVEDHIIAELESGNVWAWCTVQVRARVGQFYGDAFLGACSYEDSGDFSRDHLKAMKEEARDELRKRMDEAKKIICP